MDDGGRDDGGRGGGIVFFSIVWERVAMGKDLEEEGEEGGGGGGGGGGGRLARDWLGWLEEGVASRGGGGGGGLELGGADFIDGGIDVEEVGIEETGWSLSSLWVDVVVEEEDKVETDGVGGCELREKRPKKPPLHRDWWFSS